jgi:hypothetical protein
MMLQQYEPYYLKRCTTRKALWVFVLVLSAEVNQSLYRSASVNADFNVQGCTGGFKGFGRVI